MTVKIMVAALLMTCSMVSSGAIKRAKKDATPPLQQFVERVSGEQPASLRSPGSLWPLEGGPLVNLATDYKAHGLNDIVVIRIVEQTVAQATGSVAAQRTFTADSGISALAGQINTAGVDQLFSPHSESNLKGSGTANSQSQLQKNLAGRVVAMLPNGNMVIEAESKVSFNQQTQTVVLRGLIRPGDISSDNSVPSTSISDLEVELKGKGVVSDSTRQPNLFVRLLLKLVGF